MRDFIPALLLLVFVAAVSFVFYGNRLIAFCPSVNRLRRAKNLLGPAQLDMCIPAEETISVICARVLFHLIAAEHRNGPLQAFLHRSIGDVVEIVHYRERSLRRIVKELQTYALLVSGFGVVGFLRLLHHTQFVFSVSEMWRKAGEDPFEMLALYEFAMLVLFLVRLRIEVRAIGELFEEV